MTKPDTSFPRLGMQWGFPCKLASLMISLGALSFQLLFLFINPGPLPQISTLPMRSCTKPVFYSCIIWKSSSTLLVFAKYDIVLQASFPLPSSAVKALAYQTGCTKTGEYFSLYFCTLRRLHLLCILHSCTYGTSYVSWHYYRQWEYRSEKSRHEPILTELTQ